MRRRQGTDRHRRLAQAQKVGKIEAGWQIPEAQRHNTPQALEARLAGHRSASVLPLFPLGCDFDATEQTLLPVLGRVRSRAAATPKWKLLAQFLFDRRQPSAAQQPYLQRLALDAPQGLENRVARMLVLDELAKAGIA